EPKKKFPKHPKVMRISSRMISVLFMLLMSASAEDHLLYHVFASVSDKPVPLVRLRQKDYRPYSIGVKEDIHSSYLQGTENILARMTTTKRQKRTMHSGFTDFPYRYERVPGVYPEKYPKFVTKNNRAKLKDPVVKRRKITGVRKRLGETHRNVLPSAPRPDAMNRIDTEDIKHMVQNFDPQPIQSILPDFGHLKLR
ncbi:hypothetical protein SK128_026877, partial [Halocaridina rubra]